METVVNFITEVGVLGVLALGLHALWKERIVMGPRFREMQQDRDYWRDKAEHLERQLFGSPATPTEPPPKQRDQ